MHSVAVLRRIPLTVGYICVLTATTITLHVLDAAQRRRVLLASSTNLHQLSRVPVRVLIASALWISSGRVLPWAILLGAVAGTLEWTVGSRSTALVFATGHVLASVIVGGGLAMGIAAGVVSPSIERVVDVGPSYGFAAVAAVLAAFVPRRWRAAYLLLFAGWLGVGLSDGIDFTAIGHLTAAGIGFALVPFVRRRRPRVWEP
jgi:hypothetical protein